VRQRAGEAGTHGVPGMVVGLPAGGACGKLKSWWEERPRSRPWRP